MVGPDLAMVDRQLRSGRLACRGCGGVLRPWGWAVERVVRHRDRSERLAPRRARCRGCAVTHVLLPVSCLLRRLDAVEVIGAALLAKAAGSGHRPIAAALGRPATTVRGWLRRFAAAAEALRVAFTRLALALDPGSSPPAPPGCALADTASAIGAAAAAAVRRFGPRSPWWLAGAATGGRLLAPDAITGELIIFGGVGNTTSPWAGAGETREPAADPERRRRQDREAGRGRDRTRERLV